MFNTFLFGYVFFFIFKDGLNIIYHHTIPHIHLQLSTQSPENPYSFSVEAVMGLHSLCPLHLPLCSS